MCTTKRSHFRTYFSCFTQSDVRTYSDYLKLRHHTISEYEKCKTGVGKDSFYVKVNVDREKANTDELELRQGEVVYVDNTVFNGKLGRWRAWSLDAEGRPRQCGIMPAKYKFV